MWVDPPPGLPKASPPEVLVTYRINMAVTQHDSPLVAEALKRIPFQVSFVHAIDESAWFADLLLPEDCEMEALQMFTIGGEGGQDVYWQHFGFGIRQPVTERLYNTMNITDIMTEVAYRTGKLAQYNEYINSGDALRCRLKDTPWELEPDKKYSAEELFDRVAKATTTDLSRGEVTYNLDWFKQAGGFFIPVPKDDVFPAGSTTWARGWFLYPVLKKRGMRFEIPYQERLKRIHEELRRRLHEHDIYWWDPQINEIDFLIPYEDVEEVWDEVVTKVYGKKPEDYPFWLLCTRSAQSAWGSGISLAEINELTEQVQGHNAIQMNARAAKQLGIKDGDKIWIESPYGKMKGTVKLRQGVRPDVLLTTGIYGHWTMPVAKDLGIPNMNSIQETLVETMAITGSTNDKCKVKVYKA